MGTIRRLTLCLDGTWNNRDSSTNVLHHYSLVPEFTDKPVGHDIVTQRTFYHEGVGTAAGLDHLTGGAFGEGIEANIRELYRFLVYNYEPGDELYFLGFSRGAFTARTLAGFMNKLGLFQKDDD